MFEIAIFSCDILYILMYADLEQQQQQQPGRHQLHMGGNHGQQQQPNHHGNTQAMEPTHEGVNVMGPTTEALMSHLDAYFQQHNALLNGMGSGGGQHMPMPQLSIPGLSVANPLQSVVIGRNGDESRRDERKSTPNTPLLGPMKSNGTPMMHQQQGYHQSVSPMVPSLMHADKGGDKGTKGTRGVRKPVREKDSRSSKFRGVTKHRRSGRYEAHIWVKDLGKQVYLGGYEHEEHAAEAYDIAALKSKGRRTRTNFDISKYDDLVGCIDRMSMDELVMAIRRQSQGFSRGSSSFRGVTQHPSGRWEARIGVPGAKHVYLGLFKEEREAAISYDKALVRLRGRSAATNFSLADYRKELGDFHRMQSRMLRNDPKFVEFTSNSASFDTWVKYGSQAFPELDSPVEDEERKVQETLDAAPQHIPMNHQTTANAALPSGLGPAGMAVQQAAAAAHRDDGKDVPDHGL